MKGLLFGCFREALREEENQAISVKAAVFGVIPDMGWNSL